MSSSFRVSGMWYPRPPEVRREEHELTREETADFCKGMVGARCSFEHLPVPEVGVVDKAWMDDTNAAHCEVVLSDDQSGQRIKALVADSIRKGEPFGFSATHLIRENGKREFREMSIVSTPLRTGAKIERLVKASGVGDESEGITIVTASGVPFSENSIPGISLSAPPSETSCAPPLPNSPPQPPPAASPPLTSTVPAAAMSFAEAPAAPDATLMSSAPPVFAPPSSAPPSSAQPAHPLPAAPAANAPAQPATSSHAQPVAAPAQAPASQSAAAAQGVSLGSVLPNIVGLSDTVQKLAQDLWGATNVSQEARLQAIVAMGEVDRQRREENERFTADVRKYADALGLNHEDALEAFSTPKGRALAMTLMAKQATASVAQPQPPQPQTVTLGALQAMLGGSSHAVPNPQRAHPFAMAHNPVAVAAPVAPAPRTPVIPQSSEVVVMASAIGHEEPVAIGVVPRSARVAFPAAHRKLGVDFKGGPRQVEASAIGSNSREEVVIVGGDPWLVLLTEAASRPRVFAPYRDEA